MTFVKNNFADYPHCEDGPAIVWKNGSKFWFINGKRHRTDGPAVIFNHNEEWWVNGELKDFDLVFETKDGFFINNTLIDGPPIIKWVKKYDHKKIKWILFTQIIFDKLEDAALFKLFWL